MYFVVGLQGQTVASVAPWASGAPTVCMQGTKAPSAPSTSHTLRPMRVISRMFTAT